MLYMELNVYIDLNVESRASVVLIYVIILCGYTVLSNVLVISFIVLNPFLSVSPTDVDLNFGAGTSSCSSLLNRRFTYLMTFLYIVDKYAFSEPNLLWNCHFFVLSASRRRVCSYPLSTP